ncbi:MAG: zinc-dependent alcohol dehydrogenase family protein [Actinomycetia bacterium]|nr:zinc-dependent alcohol dehydrogenase family protein [Actinomycetes bacterium]
MKVFLVNSPGNDAVTDIKIPTPASDEVLIEVKAAGICGTDMHIYKGEYFGGYPRIPGHEFCGIVTDIGKDVRYFNIGQRVSADPNIFCEKCTACQQNKQNFCENFAAVGVTRHGAFAQYVTVPDRCVFNIGDMSFTNGAMIEPLACVVYGQENARPPVGGNVLIIGAGPIGLMHTQLACINGAATVTVIDLFPEKLALAKKLGAKMVYSSKEFDNMKAVNSYELVIDCTGIPTVVENSVKYIKDAGTLLLFGVAPENSRISINPYEIFKRELKIVGSFALKKTFGKALDLINSGCIDVTSLVDKKLLLPELPGFFNRLKSGNSGLKTLVYPNGIN